MSACVNTHVRTTQERNGWAGGSISICVHSSISLGVKFPGPFLVEAHIVGADLKGGSEDSPQKTGVKIAERKALTDVNRR